MDFIIYHPTKWENSLIIECKWQQSLGLVDEIYRYLALNIKTKDPTQTIVLIDGDGMRKGAVEWLKSAVEDNTNLIGVMNIMEFLKWSNNENI